MLKYLIVQLDDSSTSFCHYDNHRVESRLMPINILKKAVVWAMKENLMIQFVFPDYDLPEEYYHLIDSVDHIRIKQGGSVSDVNVFNGLEHSNILKNKKFENIVLRITKKDLFENTQEIVTIIRHQPSVNIVIVDVADFKETDFTNYKNVLDELSDVVSSRIASNEQTNINVLTDRLSLNSMNNCNAGNESITIAPNGSFYICPAFYFDGEDSVGNINDGLNIPNPQLYELEFAPICRKCDAFQCKRCIWLNKKTTLEVNTPSHEQCVAAHLERNASRALLDKLSAKGRINITTSIPQINYLDPFETITH